MKEERVSQGHEPALTLGHGTGKMNGSAVPGNLKNRPRIPTPDVTKEVVDREQRLAMSGNILTPGALLSHQIHSGGSPYHHNHHAEPPVVQAYVITPFPYGIGKKLQIAQKTTLYLFILANFLHSSLPSLEYALRFNNVHTHVVLSPIQELESGGSTSPTTPPMVAHQMGGASHLAQSILSQSLSTVGMGASPSNTTMLATAAPLNMATMTLTPIAFAAGAVPPGSSPSLPPRHLHLQIQTPPHQPVTLTEVDEQNGGTSEDRSRKTSTASQTKRSEVQIGCDEHDSRLTNLPSLLDSDREDTFALATPAQSDFSQHQKTIPVSRVISSLDLNSQTVAHKDTTVYLHSPGLFSPRGQAA
uniref:Uncharacterized protein n=1 Tax=Timema douglasi TaxID=61478 RepID=A0A7R8VWF6_TIMDO|nr:unnamed protein product [Timema douglasi]